MNIFLIYSSGLHDPNQLIYVVLDARPFFQPLASSKAIEVKYISSCFKVQN